MDESSRRALVDWVRGIVPPQPVMDALVSQLRQAEGINRSVSETARAIAGVSPQLFLPASSKVLTDALAAVSSPTMRSAFAAVEVSRQANLRAMRTALGSMPRIDPGELLVLQRAAKQILGPMSQIAALQAGLARQYTDALATMRSFAPDLMGSVVEAIRGNVVGRSYLRWMAAAELQDRSWWLVPTWDDALLRRILKAVGGRRGQRALVQVLRAHYERRRCRALGTMIGSWTLPELVERRPLLRDALAAYRSRRYRTAVKLLSGVEEAVVKDFLVRAGRITPQTARNTKAPTLLKLHVTKGRAALVPFEIAFADLFTDFVWGTTWRGHEVKRHRIAHGGVPQNRPVLALRLFLFLDTLDHFLVRLP